MIIKTTKCVYITLFCFFLLFSNSFAFTHVLNPKQEEISKFLFGLNVINLEWGAAWPSVQFSSMRNSKTMWSKIELRKGIWNFSQADKEISVALRQGVEVVLILGSTPIWASQSTYVPSDSRLYSDVPKNIEDWKNYVKTVVKRYKGRVHIYEMWNEPNVERFFSGSVEDLITLNQAAYSIIKEIDPDSIVISSAMATPGAGSLKYFDEFLRKGGANYADVIGYHFYVCPKSPEHIVEGIKKVKDILNKHHIYKPIWNTETGWNIINNDFNESNFESWAGLPLSHDQAVAYIARSYILTWAGGVDRFYWYAWGHRGMGLTEHDAVTPKPVAKAYSVIQNWLVGSIMTDCHLNDNTWVCKLKKEKGYEGFIIWNTENEVFYDIPSYFIGQLNLRRLDGTVESIDKNVKRILVGPMPILIDNTVFE